MAKHADTPLQVDAKLTELRRHLFRSEQLVRDLDPQQLGLGELATLHDDICHAQSVLVDVTANHHAHHGIGETP